jgi:hypothetical protein
MANNFTLISVIRSGSVLQPAAISIIEAMNVMTRPELGVTQSGCAEIAFMEAAKYCARPSSVRACKSLRYERRLEFRGRRLFIEQRTLRQNSPGQRQSGGSVALAGRWAPPEGRR